MTINPYKDRNPKWMELEHLAIKLRGLSHIAMTIGGDKVKRSDELDGCSWNYIGAALGDREDELIDIAFTGEPK